MPRIKFDNEKHIYGDGAYVPSVTSIIKPVTPYDDLPLDPKVIKEAAERGTAVHSLCALVDDGFPIDPPDELVGYVEAYRHFLELKRPRVLISELPLYEPQSNFAGMPDRVYRIGKKNWLVDIKTTSEIMKSSFVQLAGYARLVEADGIKLDEWAILHLKPDGKFKLQKVEKIERPLYDAVFKSCQNIAKFYGMKRKQK